MSIVSRLVFSMVERGSTPFPPLTSVALFTLGGRIIIDNNCNREQSRNYRIIMQPQEQCMIREVEAGANKCQMLTNRQKSCEKVKVITMENKTITNHNDVSLHGQITSQKHFLQFFSLNLLLFYINQKNNEDY